MMQTKNFFGSVMNCAATVVDWAALNKLSDCAAVFFEYFGNYMDDDGDNAWALFGNPINHQRYCVKID